MNQGIDLPDAEVTDSTKAEITACKSWVNVTYAQYKTGPGEETVFTLPIAVTSPTLTYDFGVGGYVFGKLQAEQADEVVWRTQFTEDGAHGGRWRRRASGLHWRGGKGGFLVAALVPLD